MFTFFLCMFSFATAGCDLSLIVLPKPIVYEMSASWYEKGHRTASGEKFNPNGISVAHKDFPFGTELRVTNPRNGRSIVVRVNDRIPNTKGVDLDISKGGAQQLGIIKQGRTTVRVEVLPSR